MADTILPHALPTALDGRSGVQLLSLDCFDTLLWRDCHAPHDLFGALPGTSVLQRQWAEERARTAAMLRHRRGEVHLDEIYQALLPNAAADTRSAAAKAELESEAAHCFAFEPTVALMREARRRGLGVVIVSDTYLDADQLRALIARSAGEEVAAMIDRIFCSSAYGKAKAEGLYACVLDALGIPAAAILHIGDNKRADVDGVAPSGVKTLHLQQFNEATVQRLRLEAAVSAMLHPQAPELAGTHQPHRAALAAGEPQIADPAEAFGFAALGPVLHGFDRWLVDEAEALAQARGGKVHRVFLMRDGHLPLRMHRASGHDGQAIEISRFTATAATLRDAQAVERYLETEIGTPTAVLARQLLLPPGDAATLGKLRIADFLQAVRRPERMRGITRAARGFAERLVAHVRRLVNPAPGDTLMLVDLGYNGSVQNDVEALLREKLKVHVAGRYLLLREQLRSGLDKKGFIGPDHYDATTLEALCGNVAVLEQLCTAAQGSVVDYRPDGAPIRRGNSIKSRQSDVREAIQAGCLDFARVQQGLCIRDAAPNAAAMWRRGGAAALGRLMFLPLPGELAVLAAFEHDVNLGVDNTVALFDPAIAQAGLKQRGLFYMKGAERMYLPAELHGEGLALKLSLLAHKRFGLSFKYADFIDRTIALPVIVADGRDVTTGTVTATPTHDGYYIAPIPIGDCRFSVGLQFGQLYDWLQVESVRFMPVERFLSDKPVAATEERDAAPSLEGMEQSAPHLFRCADEFAFMMVPPPPRDDDRPMMLAVVFRPIAPRASAPAASTLPQLLGAAA